MSTATDVSLASTEAETIRIEGNRLKTFLRSWLEEHASEVADERARLSNYQKVKGDKSKQLELKNIRYTLDEYNLMERLETFLGSLDDHHDEVSDSLHSLRTLFPRKFRWEHTASTSTGGTVHLAVPTTMEGLELGYSLLLLKSAAENPEMMTGNNGSKHFANQLSKRLTSNANSVYTGDSTLDQESYAALMRTAEHLAHLVHGPVVDGGTEISFGDEESEACPKASKAEDDSVKPRKGSESGADELTIS